jgi:hypothetical protein
MKTKISLEKVFVAGVITLAIIFAGFTFYNISKLKNRLSDEKTKSEMILSEKLSLDKSIAKYKLEIANLQNKTSDLNISIAEANRNIQNKIAEINKLKAENGSIKNLQQKNAELESLKQQLSQEMAQINNSLVQAKSENEKLINQLTTASKTNDELVSNNAILKALFSDNFRTEAMRGKNEKLTVNAKRTNKLLVSFDLPDNISNDIHFKVVTPQGKEFSSNKDLAAIIQITEYGDGLLASSSENAFGSAGKKRVEMSYKPTQKLSKGIYQFNLYSGKEFMGSTQLRLK